MDGHDFAEGAVQFGMGAFVEVSTTPRFLDAAEDLLVVSYAGILDRSRAASPRRAAALATAACTAVDICSMSPADRMTLLAGHLLDGHAGACGNIFCRLRVSLRIRASLGRLRILSYCFRLGSAPKVFGVLSVRSQVGRPAPIDGKTSPVLFRPALLVRLRPDLLVSGSGLRRTRPAPHDQARDARDAARAAKPSRRPAGAVRRRTIPESQMTVSGGEGTLNAADVESALHDHAGEIRDCLRSASDRRRARVGGSCFASSSTARARLMTCRSSSRASATGPSIERRIVDIEAWASYVRAALRVIS